jgi:hypothetical protein
VRLSDEAAAAVLFTFEVQLLHSSCASFVTVVLCLLSLDSRDAGARQAFERLGDRLCADVVRSGRRWRRRKRSAKDAHEHEGHIAAFD